MKYLKTYRIFEDINIFNSDWESNLPNEVSIITSTGEFTLKLKSDKDLGHRDDVSNLMNCIQVSYYRNDMIDNDDAVQNAEPDYLCFDITIVKNNDGYKRNPDTIKLNIDISYGDSMMFQFIIEKPNKVSLSHYNGVGSKYDPNTKFAFTDSSLKSLVDFFNTFGYKLSIDDFKFLDNNDDSFKYKDEPNQLYSDKISNMDIKARNSKDFDINEPISLELQNNESMKRKHIESVNEFYHRTLGFKYSEPNLKFTVSCYYFGQISEDQLVSALQSGDIVFDNVSVGSESGEINIQDLEGAPRDIKVDGQMKFDLSVYSEREIDTIIDNLSKLLYVNHRVKLVDVSVNEHGKKDENVS